MLSHKTFQVIVSPEGVPIISTIFKCYAVIFTSDESSSTLKRLRNTDKDTK